MSAQRPLVTSFIFVLSLSFGVVLFETEAASQDNGIEQVASVQLLDIFNTPSDASGYVTLLAGKSRLEIEQLLLGCGGRTDDHGVGARLTALRRMGAEASASKPVLLSLMSERSSLYENRSKNETVRLRAYVLLTLADTGNAEAATPYIFDYIENTNDYSLAYEAGVAARAAGALGPQAWQMLDGLVTLYFRAFTEPEFSLQSYEADVSQETATTAHLEILLAIRRIGVRGNSRARQLLESCAGGAGPNSLNDPRIAEIARDVIEHAARSDMEPESQPDISISRFSTLPRDVDLDIAYTDQDGNRGNLRDLIDRPTAVVFFYTRCTNTQKCSATVSQIAQLQTVLDKREILSRARLIGVTYEPEYDDSAKLKNYGLGRKVAFDDSTKFIQLDLSKHAKFISSMEIPVAYNEGWVTAHTIILFLFDSCGHLVARYERGFWDNDDVANELSAMLVVPQK